MPELILTDEQVRAFPKTPIPVTVKDSQGRVIGHLEPVPSPEWIAEMKRRSAAPGPRYSSKAVVAMLDALQAERDRIGPFDSTYMREFVQRLEEAEPEKYGSRERS